MSIQWGLRNKIIGLFLIAALWIIISYTLYYLKSNPMSIYQSFFKLKKN